MVAYICPPDDATAYRWDDEDEERLALTEPHTALSPMASWGGDEIDPDSLALDQIGWRETFDVLLHNYTSMLPTKVGVVYFKSASPFGELPRIIRLVGAGPVRPATRVGSGGDASASQFRALADQWYAETGILSGVEQMVLHPAYQRIIGLGPAVVPLILAELQHGPGHWFWALTALTGEDPAAGEDTVGAATRAWLAWGRERGHLS